MERIAQHYTLPDRDYLRDQLEALREEFREFEQSIAGGQDCFCVDNDPPQEAPADNGCDCNPCNCPTDRHPCYAGSQFNNGDRSTAGLRGALARLQRRARELQAAQDAGTAWAACGAEAQGGDERPHERGDEQGDQQTGPPGTRPLEDIYYTTPIGGHPRKPAVHDQSENRWQDESQDCSKDQSNDHTNDQSSQSQSQSEYQPHWDTSTDSPIPPRRKE
ncbi:hypothetical protein UCDDA912_g05773 [Diaporthe ampelina]|uniref:Uncharacterized protein n=1 Tax=Diaporthe ampelina TaxID=1214573 RepID=A0A0G2I2C9_9PEZI|nr:hypothetical protein UCDDA912_g05773 [Diaporthe ampelina]